MFTRIAACVLAGLVLLTSDETPPRPPEVQRAGTTRFVVHEISADGSIAIESAGATSRVRLAGLAPPDPDWVAELIAGEIRLLAGESVRIEYPEPAAHADAGAARPALLYRVPDGLCVNVELVREGAARAALLGDREIERTLSFYEARARGARKGIWRERAATDGSDPPVATQPAAGGRGAAVRPPASAPGEGIVYVTKSGKKYHRASCSHAKQSGRPIPLAEARRTYAPCSQCDPPP